MKRRDALAIVTSLFGTALIGSEAFLSGCAPKKVQINQFNKDVLALLDEIGETIIPATKGSPGAKAAKIGEFMKVIVSECYSPEETSAFMKGLEKLVDDVSATHGKSFLELSGEEKTSVIANLDNDAKAKAKTADSEHHIFDMLNQLTTWGYFSSEPGATTALRYVPIPGEYKGCIDYHKGEGAWIY